MLAVLYNIMTINDYDICTGKGQGSRRWASTDDFLRNSETVSYICFKTLQIRHLPLHELCQRIYPAGFNYFCSES